MGVLPEYRGQRNRPPLIVTAINAARELGVMRIDLEVRGVNAAAIALYHSVGFIDGGIKRAAMRVDGQYFNMLQMALVYEGMA